jgi:hypothetical protein
MHNSEKINGNMQAFHVAQIAINLLQYFHIKLSFTRSGKRHDNRGKEKRSARSQTGLMPTLWSGVRYGPTDKVLIRNSPKTDDLSLTASIAMIATKHQRLGRWPFSVCPGTVSGTVEVAFPECGKRSAWQKMVPLVCTQSTVRNLIERPASDQLEFTAGTDGHP